MLLLHRLRDDKDQCYVHKDQQIMGGCDSGKDLVMMFMQRGRRAACFRVEWDERKCWEGDNLTSYV